MYFQDFHDVVLNMVIYLDEHLLTKSPFAPTLPWNPYRNK